MSYHIKIKTHGNVYSLSIHLKRDRYLTTQHFINFTARILHGEWYVCGFISFLASPPRYWSQISQQQSPVTFAYLIPILLIFFFTDFLLLFRKMRRSFSDLISISVSSLLERSVIPPLHSGKMNEWNILTLNHFTIYILYFIELLDLSNKTY